MYEGLQNHVEEAGGAHVAQTAGHAAHTWQGLVVGRAGVVHAELVECVFLDARHARAVCLAQPDVLEAWVVHDVVACRAKQGAVHDVAGIGMCFFREVQSDVRRPFFGAVRGGLICSARHGQRGVAHRITKQARCVRTREAEEGAPQIDAAGGARRVGKLGSAVAHTYLAPLAAAHRRIVRAVSWRDVPIQQFLAVSQAGHVPLEPQCELRVRLALQVLAPGVLFAARRDVRWESHACHGREPRAGATGGGYGRRPRPTAGWRPPGRGAAWRTGGGRVAVARRRRRGAACTAVLCGADRDRGVCAATTRGG